MSTATASVRDLRNRGGDILERVQRGEELTVTSGGKPVARLVPLPTVAPSPQELVRRWRNLPPVSLEALRADLDDAIESDL